LTAAIAEGAGAVATLVKAVKVREAERARLERTLADFAELEAAGAIVVEALRARLTSTLADWRGLLGRHPQQARAILTKVLAGRLVFTPQTDASAGTRSHRFTGERRLERLLPGVLTLPKALVTPEGESCRP